VTRSDDSGKQHDAGKKILYFLGACIGAAVLWATCDYGKTLGVTETKKAYAESIERREKKYSVFISSTYKDLSEVRANVEKVLLAAEYIPIGMEYFLASSTNKLDYIKKNIDKSDYFLLLIGKQYGKLIPGRDIGYTEWEFDYAMEKGKIVLPFVITNAGDGVGKTNFPDKLEAFKGRIPGTPCHCSKEEIVGKVIASLDDAISMNPQGGWIRIDDMLRDSQVNSK
jgi:hypothetical protein